MESVKVLIVEDDPMVAEINRRFVEEMSAFEVVGVANSLQDAYDFLKSREVDLVLLDVFFPEGEGLDLLRRVREEELDVDFVLITAASDGARIERALRHGAVDYIIKPFDKKRFQEALLKYLRQKAKLEKGDLLSQTDVDEIARSGSSELLENLPKNMSEMTFAKVMEHVRRRKSLTAADLASDLGVSRVTAQKYLDYLTTMGVVDKDLEYRKTGRPTYIYVLRED